MLGTIINEKGIRPTNKGLKAITNFPSPTRINQLRSFLGLSNYFPRYIPNFSKITFPLTELTKGNFKTKNDKIQWENFHEMSFNNLKNKLITPPVLIHFKEEADTYYTITSGVYSADICKILFCGYSCLLFFLNIVHITQSHIFWVIHVLLFETNIFLCLNTFVSNHDVI